MANSLNGFDSNDWADDGSNDYLLMKKQIKNPIKKGTEQNRTDRRVQS